MKLGRWSVAVVGLASAMLLATLPALAQDDVKWEWKAFNKGSTIWQKLKTETKQTMKVMGQEVKQTQNQTFYLKYVGLEGTKDGNLVVQQTITGVVMSIDIGGVNIAFNSTDDKQPANPMTDFFKKLLEADLKLTIDPATMTVKSIDKEGVDKLVKALTDTNPAMGTLLKTILSEKALIQMAEPTWGAFPKGGIAKKGVPWDKKSTLDLGPIGIYETNYKYTYEGADKEGPKIKVDSSLTYSAPTEKEKAGLPFTIKSASLKSKEGSGSAIFDPANGRFKSSTITMTLEGTLQIDVGGMVTDVELTQVQTATVETTDTDPLKAATPPKK